MKTIRGVNVKNKTVLVRVDYNVPVKNGKVINNLRIKASLPTLEYLREAGAKKIILISHLGRPEGRDKSLSLAPVAESLGKLISNVSFIDDVSGPDVESATKKIKDGGILLLENLRFYSGETSNSDDFIREIIGPSFGLRHQASLPSVGITRFMASMAHSIMLSSGSRVVTCWSHLPGAEMTRVSRLSVRPAHLMSS